MGENRKNILVLTYYFPPDDNISSRRWAKLSKYLKSSGQHVCVLTSQTDNGSFSPWDDDIKDLEVFTYERDYPKILDTVPKTLVQKLKYRLAIRKLKRKMNGTIYDRSGLIEARILEKAEQIIKEKSIDVLITNGPPHRIMYYGTKLKEKFPSLFLISDFRDPWTWWYNYGYPFLSEENKLLEETMERKVVEESNVIFAPDLGMKTYIEKKYNKNVTHLPHGFDLADMPTIKKNKSYDGSRMKLVYYGNLYDDQEKVFQNLANQLKLFPNITVDIFSSYYNYKSIFEVAGLTNQVRYHSTLKSSELFKRLLDFDGVMMAVPEKFNNIFSSKFYEIAYSQLPILYLGYEGELAEFISINQMGKVIVKDYERELDNFFKNGFGNLSRTDIDWSKYTFEKQASEIVKMINT